jgi:hypothetical protein
MEGFQFGDDKDVNKYFFIISASHLLIIDPQNSSILPGHVSLSISYLAEVDLSSGGRPNFMNIRAIHRTMNAEDPARRYHMREMSGRLFGCRLDWIA